MNTFGTQYGQDIEDDQDASYGRNTPSLCHKCSSLDLYTVFNTKLDVWEGDSGKIVAVRGPEEFRPDVCPLCRMFISLSPAVPLDRWSQFEIKAYSMSSALLQLKKPQLIAQDETVLSVELRSLHREQRLLDFIARVHDTDSRSPPRSLFPREIDPRSVDLGAIEQWYEFCSRSHAKCSPPESATTAHSKLIDCHSMQIITASPHWEYVALSYVWGSSEASSFWADVYGDRDWSEDIDYPLDLPNNLSQVIQDSISVVIGIRQRYLWVDQFCINQLNKKEKSAEIEKMDLIYRGASLTIIAAAGENADYGLPGVGTRPRAPQIAVDLGDLILTTTNQNPRGVIRESKWITRGWTFQEAIFSRRKLYFTDQQIYYECNGMNCQESISLRLEDYPPELFGKKLFPGELARGIYTTDNNNVERSFLENVALYSSRDLTYTSDALNAFRGTLRAFETAEPPLHHCWGLPTYPSDTPALPRYYFPYSLLWEFPSNISRRAGFPSWSWLGWTGQPYFPKSIDVIDGGGLGGNWGTDYGTAQGTDKRAIGTEVKISVRRNDNILLPLDSVQDAIRVTAHLEKLSTHLHIETAVVPFRLEQCFDFNQTGKAKTTLCQKKLAQLQNRIWSEYSLWKSQVQGVPYPTHSTTCDCPVGFVVPDPDAKAKGHIRNGGGHRAPSQENGMTIEAMQFLLKSEDGICLAHPGSTPETSLVLLGFHETSWKPYIAAAPGPARKLLNRMLDLATNPTRNFTVDLSFVLVRPERSGTGLERIGTVRVSDEDGLAWRQIARTNRYTIELG